MSKFDASLYRSRSLRNFENPLIIHNLPFLFCQSVIPSVPPSNGTVVNDPVSVKTTDAAETVAATLARAAKRNVLQRRRCCMAGQPGGHVENGKYGLERGKWCFLPEPLDMPQQIFPTLQSRRVLICDECYSLWLNVSTGLPRLREVPIPPVALWLHPGWPQGSSRWVLIIHGESIKNPIDTLEYIGKVDILVQTAYY